MRPPNVLASASSDALDRLTEAARPDPGAVALRHKRRGVWWAWSWRDIVTLTDGIASYLRAAGIGEGAAIALSGEIGPPLLLGALAAGLVGTDVISVPPQSTARDIASLLRARSVSLAVVQGRQALATWLDARQAAALPVSLVFDHAGDAPGAGDFVPIAALLGHVAAHGWADALCRPVPSRLRRPTIWAEADTDGPGAIDAVIDAWLASGDVLALPENLAGAARDRLDARPDRWIASPRRAASAAREIADRLPMEGSFAHRMVAPLFAAPASPHPLRHLLRRRLGLGRVSDLDLGSGPVPDEATDRIFAGLGVTLRAAPAAAAKSPPARPIRHLVLAEDAR